MGSLRNILLSNNRTPQPHPLVLTTASILDTNANKLSYETVKNYAVELLQALEKIHELGYVFRNLNPDSVYLVSRLSIETHHFVLHSKPPKNQLTSHLIAL